MGFLNAVTLLLTHPTEFRLLLQFWLYHEQTRIVSEKKEWPTTGWDRDSMRVCWETLAALGGEGGYDWFVRELKDDLARVVCLFALACKALEIIETANIDSRERRELLQDFHIHTITPEWSLPPSILEGMEIRHYNAYKNFWRDYPNVVQEINRLSPEYKSLISTTMESIGAGLAQLQSANPSLQSSMFDRHAFLTSGIPQTTLARLMSTSTQESNEIGSATALAAALGTFVGKVSAIRSISAAIVSGQCLWPEDTISLCGFSSAKELAKEDGTERRRWVISFMVLDALSHVPDALDFLRLLKKQQNFNFCAVPLSLGIATLAMCFMNPTIFEAPARLNKAQSADLILRSVNPRDVALICREYVRKIHAKAIPSDPAFLKISVACGKVETAAENAYPSFVQMSSSKPGQQVIDTSDPRSRVIQAEIDQQQSLLRRRKLAQVRKRIMAAGGDIPPAPEKKIVAEKAEPVPRELIFWIVAALLGMAAFCLGSVLVLIKIVNYYELK